MRRTPRLPVARALAAAAAVLALFVTVGCGSSGDGSGSSTNGSRSGTLTVWHNFTLDSQLELLRRQERLFKAKYPDVKLKYVYVSGSDTDQKLIASAPTGTGPDVILHDAQGAVALKQANAIADMTQCVSTWATESDLTPFSRRVIDGRTYGVLPYGNLVALWYNRTLLDKYGLEPPRTMDELEAAMAKITAGGDTGMTISATPNDEGAWSFYPVFSAYGVIPPKFTSPATDQVFTRIAHWADEGWIPRSASTMDQVTAMSKFFTGKVGFSVNGNWNVTEAKRAAKFDYGVTVIPTGTEPGHVYISGESGMIGNFSKNPQLACAYLGDSWFSRAGQQASLELNKSIPTLRSALSDPAITSDPQLSVFAKQAENADTIPGGQAFVAMSTVWGPAVSAAVAGTRDPSEISSETIDSVNRVLAEGDN